MDEHRDDMERRRQKRAALNKKKKQEQQKMKRRLILAAVIVVVCGLFIFAMTGDNENSGQAGEEQQIQNVTEVATEVPDTPSTTIHIKACGDLNVTDLSVEAGNTRLGYDYTKVFMDVAPLLSDADLTILNFEGNLIGPPYGTQSGSAPQEMMTALARAGVDIIQMANSYSVYNGMIGLNQTLNGIRAAGMEPVGAFSSPEEFRKSRGYTICEIQGVKVAIVAFTKGMGGLGLPSGNESCVNKLYVDYESTYRDIDEDGIKSILRNVASERPDITIALLHWGAEYNDTVFKSQETIAELMLKNGVDVIIGTHPHMVHKIEFDEEENTLIAYSLGDFFGDATKSGSNYSIILDIQITRDNTTGVTKIDDFTCTPIYTLTEAQGGGQRRVVRIDDAMAAFEVNFVDKVTQEAYDSMAYSLERIEQRIATPRTVECPECGRDLEVLVNKLGKLVSDKTCTCGEVLNADSDYSDYE